MLILVFDVVSHANILEELNSLESLDKFLIGIQIVMLLKWEVKLDFEICDDI